MRVCVLDMHFAEYEDSLYYFRGESLKGACNFQDEILCKGLDRALQVRLCHFKMNISSRGMEKEPQKELA